jgi:hypothetical protein
MSKGETVTLFGRLTRKDWESRCTVRDKSSETDFPALCCIVDAAWSADRYAFGSCSDSWDKVRRCSSTLRLYLSRADQEASAGSQKQGDQNGATIWV